VQDGVCVVEVWRGGGGLVGVDECGDEGADVEDLVDGEVVERGEGVAKVGDESGPGVDAVLYETAQRTHRIGYLFIEKNLLI